MCIRDSGYGDPIELPCPIELISMGGIICTEQDGKISLHVHAAFADVYKRQTMRGTGAELLADERVKEAYLGKNG